MKGPSETGEDGFAANVAHAHAHADVAVTAYAAIVVITFTTEILFLQIIRIVNEGFDDLLINLNQIYHASEVVLPRNMPQYSYQ